MPSDSSKKFWVVLIGINYYKHYSRLQGCVQDVEDVEQMLRSHLRQEQLDITKITASGPNEPHPPTYDHVMRALTAAKSKAQPGDFVYIHFSGHGGQESIVDDPKHPKHTSAIGKHEVLVLEGDRHIKDYELGQFLDGLVADGLVPFACLDCCHSGGADRTGQTSVRGVDVIPSTYENAKEDASPGQFNSMEPAQVGLTRDASSSKSYWERARNYNVLAACQAHEKAKEHDHQGKTNGALTHWMIKSLGQLSNGGGTLTYQRLHRNIYANMLVNFPSQHCMLFGDGDRLLFRDEQLQDVQAARVIEIDGPKVYVDIGEVHGVVVGEEYAIYPSSAPNLDPGQTIATLRINRVGGLRSSGKLTGNTSGVGLGCLAKLLTSVPNDPVHVKVQSVEMLQRLREFQQKQVGVGIPIIFHAIDDQNDAIYQVLLNDCYQISDTTGTLIPNCPSVPVDEEDADAKIHQIIRNLTRYKIVAALHNKKSKLNNSFALRVVGDAQPDDKTGITEVSHGDNIEVEFENFSDQHLYYTVFDLTPRWGVVQLIPWQTGESRGVGAKLKSETMEMEMSIPDLEDGTEEGLDLFKVIVTTEPSQFEMLRTAAMPKRGSEPWRGKLDEGASYGLGDFLERLRENLRDAVPVNSSARYGDWQTAEVIVKTKVQAAHPS